MVLRLPKPIEVYMSSENARDIQALGACFMPDATVKDEGRTMTGLKAIADWRRETLEKYQHTTEPVAVFERDGKTVVTSKLSGNFPGSPVTLEFVFKLQGDKIVSLEIQS